MFRPLITSTALALALSVTTAAGLHAEQGSAGASGAAESTTGMETGTQAKPGNAQGGQDTRPGIAEETVQGQPPQGVMDQDTEMQKGSVMEEHLDRREQLDEDQDRSIDDRPAGGQFEKGTDEDFPN